MTTRARRYPQPRPAAEVLAETRAEPCSHGGLPGRCPMCRATAPVPPGPAAPRPRRRRRKPKPPPVQLTLADAEDLGPAPREDQ